MYIPCLHPHIAAVISGRFSPNLPPSITFKWHPTPVLLPGKSHGQRSLVGCSPWGHKELDTTKRLTLSHTHFGGFWFTVLLFSPFPQKNINSRKAKTFLFCSLHLEESLAHVRCLKYFLYR